MEKVLDIISRWDHLGQGVFFIIVAAMFFGTVYGIFRWLTILVRGWPSDPKAQQQLSRPWSP